MRWTENRVFPWQKSPTRVLLCFLCGLACSTIASAAEDGGPAASSADESWQIIFIGENRVGYSRSSSDTIEKEGEQRIRSTNETHMALKRFGQEIKMSTNLVTEETLDGKLIRYVYTMHNPPAVPARTEGVVKGDKVDLTIETGGRVQTRSLAWDATAKSPAYQDRLLRESPLQPGDVREFKTFLPEFSRVTEVKITADRLRPVRLHDNTQRELMLAKIQQSVLPTMTVRAWIDQHGTALKTETDFLGSKLVTYEVDEAVALEELAGKELDLAVATLVPVEGGQRLRHDSKRVVYRVVTEDADPLKHFVDSEMQKVERIDPQSAKITVQALRPESSTRIVRPEPKYLESSDFLQVDDFEVREHARKAQALEQDAARIAVQMERYVHRELKEKNFSTALASAAEVAQSLEGDCTEHAVLLAAMLRAAGIGSRIAVGMVYVEGGAAFGGHMWTEAYLGGKWVPLDATLGRGGIGGGHIKMAESAFSNDDPAPVLTFLPMLKVLGKMKIEVLEVE